MTVPERQRNPAAVSIESSEFRAASRSRMSSLLQGVLSFYVVLGVVMEAQAAFSRRTPLNFFGLFFTSINSPVFLLRLVQLPASLFLSCVRFRTAPFRALSPVGLFTAIVLLLHALLESAFQGGGSVVLLQ